MHVILLQNSLQVLMERMTNSTPHFIRCIKPNSEKSANSFNEEYVQAQVSEHLDR